MIHFNVKLKVVACIFVLLIISTSNASAQSTKKLSYLFSNGISEITYSRAYSRLFKTGFNVGAGVEHPFAENIFGQIQFDLHFFSLDRKTLSLYQYSGSGIIIYSFSANIKIILPAGKAVTPYFTEGIGFSMHDFKDVYYFGELYCRRHRETPLTLYFGLGFEIPFTKRINLFTEIKYVVIFTTDESTQYIPFKIGFCINPRDH